jgi:structural maintenance of chromosome 1
LEWLVVIDEEWSLSFLLITGLMRAKETLLAQLRELKQKKPRGSTDETLIAEIGRIESAITLAKVDLVRPF